MTTRIEISKELLNWVVARVRVDLLPSSTANLINAWISGEKEPTFNQIEDVSKKTGIPLGYFFLETPPTEDLSLVDYRTVDSLELSNPSRNLIDTIHDMEQIQDWMRNCLIDEGSGPMHYVGAMREELSMVTFAQYVRSVLDIKLEWFEDTQTPEQSFNYIRSAISNAGILVMMNGIVGSNTHRPLSIDEFRGFALVDDYAPLIFINTNDSVNGRLFSLLHEVAHVFIGENSLFNDRYSTAGRVKKEETLCNAVAAEILVPQISFTAKWKEHAYEDKEIVIEDLARYYKCGITVIARKALDNHYIDSALYNRTAKMAVEKYNEKRKYLKERGNSGGDFYNTLASRIDKRFLFTLANSVYNGRTLYTDAFRFTNTNRTTFSNLINNVGGGK